MLIQDWPKAAVGDATAFSCPKIGLCGNRHLLVGELWRRISLPPVYTKGQKHLIPSMVLCWLPVPAWLSQKFGHVLAVGGGRMTEPFIWRRRPSDPGSLIYNLPRSAPHLEMKTTSPPGLCRQSSQYQRGSLEVVRAWEKASCFIWARACRTSQLQLLSSSLCFN